MESETSRRAGVDGATGTGAEAVTGPDPVSQAGAATAGVFPGVSPPLVISSYTLGIEVPFEDRVRAATVAGFDGIGLRAENYRDARAAGLHDADLDGALRRHRSQVLEVEYLTGWGTTEDRDAAQREKEATVFRLARHFGVRHLNAGLLERLPVGQITEAFAELCDRAGDDLTVALEFMPYSGVPDLATAWRVVRDCGRANSGLLVDVWHWARAGSTPSDLGPVPAERIVSVQLCDVLPVPMTPMRRESLGHRMPPGEGSGDAAGLVRALREHGVRPWIVAVEVISDELVTRGVEVAALTVARAARAVLAAAR